MKTKLILIIISIFTATSCMKEKGNYDYSDLNEITIDTLNMRTLSQFDSLKLTPVISQSKFDTEENLDFLWYWYRTDVDERIIDTLSTERNLKYYAGDEPGKYGLRLKVTDRRTGLYARLPIDIVISGGNSGLLVLSSINNKANLTIVNEAKDLFQDAYYAANGEHAGENPISIACVDIYQKLGMQEIMIFCNDTKGGVTLNYDNFVKEREIGKLFFATPSVLLPQSYTASESQMVKVDYDFIINNGRLHARELKNVGVSNPTDMLFLPEIMGDYSLSPYSFINANTLLFYDNKNYCFRVLNCGGGNISSNIFAPAPLENEANVDNMPFNPRNVGLEMIFGGEGWKPSGYVGNGYGIFRKPGTTSLDEMYCLKFNIGDKMSFTPPYGTYFVSYFKHKITQAPGMNEAKAFAISKKDPYIYYAHNNLIYSYDVEYDKAKEVYNLDTVVNKGAKVDYLYIRNGSSVELSAKMWVGSSEGDHSTKTGSIHVLTMGRNGDVTKQDTVYKNICGKVVSMSYKAR